LNHLICEIIIISILTSYSEGFLKLKIKNDEVLVVPGLGAENIVLNENDNILSLLKKDPGIICRFKSQNELFNDIFRLKSSVQINYDKICCYNSLRVIVFSRNGFISAIAGLIINRITIDSVSLQNGVDYFIFNYGNNGLQVLKKKNDKIYLYSKLGIAIVDDNSDDIIDMYIVFPPCFE